MNNNVKKGLILFGVSIFSFCLGTLVDSCNKHKLQEAYEDPIISLEEKRDSIQNQIDTVYIDLNNINVDYKKAIDTVLNNTPSEDVMFFLKYIGSQRERLDSLYSSDGD